VVRVSEGKDGGSDGSLEVGSGVETLHFFQCRMALHNDGQCRVVSIRRYRAAGKKRNHDPTRSGFGKLVALLEWQIGTSLIGQLKLHMRLVT